MGPSLGQISRVLELLRENQVSGGQLQDLFDSGILSDVLKANVDRVDREELKGVLGLGSLRSSDFEVFMTIKLGSGPQSADDFRGALVAEGIHISDRAIDIFGQPAFTLVTEETKVDLVTPTLAQLGFPHGATCRDIYYRVVEVIGLELCPAEVGPHLRSQYKNQPRGELLVVGMEPILGPGGYPLTFDVIHSENRGLSLNARINYENDLWPEDLRWVFVLPRTR